MFRFIAQVGCDVRDVGVFGVRPRLKPRAFEDEGSQSVPHALIASAWSVSTRVDLGQRIFEGFKVWGVEPWVLFVQGSKVYGC